MTDKLGNLTTGVGQCCESSKRVPISGGKECGGAQSLGGGLSHPFIGVCFTEKSLDDLDLVRRFLTFLEAQHPLSAVMEVMPGLLARQIREAAVPEPLQNIRSPPGQLGD